MRRCSISIDDEATIMRKVPTNRGQTGDLIFNRQEVLEGPERNRDERKRASEVEIAHVGVHECDA